MNRATIFVTSAAGLLLAAGLAHGDESVDFSRSAQSIISKACFACHGPDEAHREAGLRLDQRAAAIVPLDSGDVAIVPGKPETAAYRRITSTDPAERMPPHESGHALNPAQIETLRQWIAAGASYAQHWSFVAPARPPIPELQDSAGARNPIDCFIRARLAAEGRSPSAEADRYALIRRVSLDVRGLPPTPEEVNAFIADDRPDAYERLVDQFLADPAYGERMARMWLDLARYADSRGYAFDASRSIWRYRDWVIGAFNRNLPFDQFTIEQLAGDLLENPTLDQRVATAFHRNTTANVEGVGDEARISAVRDRVETTFLVWMGLTMGCARCHTHKFDPITITDYYQAYAFLNQTTDNANADDSPEIPAPTYEQQPIVERIDARITAEREALKVPDATLQAEEAAWEQALRHAELPWTNLANGAISAESGVPLTPREDGAILAGGMAAATDVYTVVADLELSGVTAIRLEALPDNGLPNAGAGRADDGGFVLSRFSAEIESRDHDPVEQPDVVPIARRPVTFQKAIADFSQAGFPIQNALKQDDITKSGWGVKPQFAKPHTASFIVEPGSGDVPQARLSVKLEQKFMLPRNLLGCFRLSVTDHPAARQQLVAPQEIMDIVKLPADQRNAEQTTKIKDYFLTVAPALEPLRKRIAEIEKERRPVPTVPVMAELASDRKRETFVMLKGNHEAPGDKIEPNVPSFFPHLHSDAPRNRLGLAEWLVSAENPLTARVMVNRLWSQFFGRGIVETEEDFGTQGASPTHPELLDWLAVEFMTPSTVSSSGAAWDLKNLVRLIVTSATYRQSSVVTPEQLRQDPRNELLARAPRFRLEAEMVAIRR